ncbi:transposase [Micromonospora fulviviridis]|uniref:transposase n=1 Tax=Micromonospora fulviviridis TaxID=47860 RepID=UPI00166A056E
MGALAGGGVHRRGRGPVDLASPDHLAAYAGLAPVARDSGKRVANLRRPQRYNRRLRHVFYMSSLSTLRSTARTGTTTSANAPRAASTSRR